MRYNEVPYTRDELEAGMKELGKNVNKIYVYLKERCLKKPCVVNLCRYNMCYGIEKAYRSSFKGGRIEKKIIGDKELYGILNKTVDKHSHRIIEKYNRNEAKHLKRIEKERKLRTREAMKNYKKMYAPENNWPKPIVIKMEKIDDLNIAANVTVESRYLESENTSMNLSFAATVQSIPNIAELNSTPISQTTNINEIIIESEVINDLSIIQNYNTFNDNALDSAVITSTQNDINKSGIQPDDTLYSQVICHNVSQDLNEFSSFSQVSFSFNTETILDRFRRKRLTPDKKLASQIIEEINRDII